MWRPASGASAAPAAGPCATANVRQASARFLRRLVKVSIWPPVLRRSLSVAAKRLQRFKRTARIYRHSKLDGLAAHLAVLDIARGAGAQVDQRLKSFTAIRTVDEVELAAACGSGPLRVGGLEHGLQAVDRIDLLVAGTALHAASPSRP